MPTIVNGLGEARLCLKFENRLDEVEHPHTYVDIVGTQSKSTAEVNNSQGRLAICRVYKENLGQHISGMVYTSDRQSQ